MQTIRRLVHNNRQTLTKTLSYYVIHITVAALVAYAVTGNLIAALTLSLLEPTVQMLFFFLHEKLWESKNQSTVHTAHSHLDIKSS